MKEGTEEGLEEGLEEVMGWPWLLMERSVGNLKPLREWVAEGECALR